jgi:hypothetical protein
MEASSWQRVFQKRNYIIKEVFSVFVCYCVPPPSPSSMFGHVMLGGQLLKTYTCASVRGYIASAVRRQVAGNLTPLWFSQWQTTVAFEDVTETHIKLFVKRFTESFLHAQQVYGYCICTLFLELHPLDSCLSNILWALTEFNIIIYEIELNFIRLLLVSLITLDAHERDSLLNVWLLSKSTRLDSPSILNWVYFS